MNLYERVLECVFGAAIVAAVAVLASAPFLAHSHEQVEKFFAASAVCIVVALAACAAGLMTTQDYS